MRDKPGGIDDFRRTRADSRPNAKRIGDAARRALDEQENREVRNRQLSREVHDFFANATRTAATIVSKVSQDQESMIDEQLCTEMSEFLQDAIRRAQQLVTMLQRTGDSRLAKSDLDANMLNLVGPLLDQFRGAGTARVHDKHLGLDPQTVGGVTGLGDTLAHGDSATTSSGLPINVTASSAKAKGGASLEDHLVADVAPARPAPPPPPARESSAPPPPPPPALWPTPAAGPEPRAPVPSPATPQDASPRAGEILFGRLRDDPEKLQRALKMMVSAGLMSKGEAVDAYRALRG